MISRRFYSPDARYILAPIGFCWLKSVVTDRGTYEDTVQYALLNSRTGRYPRIPNRILIGMKRNLIVLVTSVVLLCSSNGLAGSFSCGLSVQALVESRVTPLLPVLHVGYEFGTPSDGPSIEASLFSWIIVNRFAFQAFYRVPVDSGGSNVYFGAGAAYFYFTGLVDAGPSSSYAAFGLIGWEARIDREYTYFVEVAPGARWVNDQPAFSLRIAVGARTYR